ncbi:MAG: hypothetical protein U9R53_10370 [Chloroflexota bacterium]|nr:hypothetical protein [Chloroflexota bacterium]
MKVTKQMNKHHEKLLKWIEIVSAVLISLATITSAWCVYQSSRWAGEERSSSNRATAARTESVRFSNQALQLKTIDVAMFTEFAAAYSNEDEFLYDFLMERFRPEMKVAVDAWIETQPLINHDAPTSPFEMAEYKSEAQEESDRFLEEVEAHLDEARLDNERGDNYTLLTVIFASVLFFGGINSKFTSIKIRLGLVIIASLIIFITVFWALTFPIL